MTTKKLITITALIMAIIALTTPYALKAILNYFESREDAQYHQRLNKALKTENVYRIAGMGN